MKRSKIHKIAVIYILFLLFSGWNPDLCGASDPLEDIFVISEEAERRMGASVAEQVEKQFEETDDPLVQKRFEDIGKRLATVSDRKELVYHFKVLKAKEGEPEYKYYNAFALPGGYVYIFEPLLDLMVTDDKIAAIASHEIGHIVARHSVKRLRGSLGASALMLLAVTTSGKQETVAKTNEALTQLMMAYSRKDEIEADRLSIKFIEKAEFDKDAILQSLKTLQKMRKKGPEVKYMNYRSHPYLSERMAAVRTEITGYEDFDSYINLPEKKDDFF